MNDNGGLMEQRQATEQWIVSWGETMEAINQKIDSRFEELMELLRSMNGNSAASTSAGGGVVGGGAPVREKSWEAPRSADSQGNGESRSSGPGSWNRLDSRIEVNRTPKIENLIDESSPKMTNLDERSVSGDRNHQEPRQEFLKEVQTPEEAEFRLQQLIASSKETERQMQRLYERNQQSMIAYQRQLDEYWKQDEIEERERSINQSFEEPIHQSTDRGFEVFADSVLGKLDPELVDEDGGEPELVQEEQITNLSQEINPNMHLIQEQKYLQHQHHCESSKVIPPPLQDVVAEGASKELGKLVDLLIELIEIRLANGRTSSMMDIGLCPMEFLETYDAHKLFDKLSEPILPTKMTSGDILGKPRTKELEKLDFGSLIFYPGGEKHKRKPNDCDGISIHENGMVSNACNVLMEVLESANEVVTKHGELLPQCESYTPLVFDPGGAYVWFRIKT